MVKLKKEVKKPVKVGKKGKIIAALAGIAAAIAAIFLLRKKLRKK